MICRSTILMLADPLTRLLRPLIAKSIEKTITRKFAIGILLAALTIAGSAQPSAQNSAPGPWQTFLIPEGETVYDIVNHVTWLADGNLPAMSVPGSLNFRFGLPLCPDLTIEPAEPCVNLSGSMNYTSAVAWVQGMNDANYLGHHDWQLPTAPSKDRGCSGRGPSPYREWFAFGCDKNALGSLYYDELGFMAPATAVPFPPNTVGPFTNLQPNLYWSGSGGGGLGCTIANFSFASGAQGGGCGGDFADVLPMIKGEVLGMPIPAGSSELYVNPGGQTVYDPETNVTWLADANLAANWLSGSTLGEFDTLGLPRCETAPDTKPCVALDGSMNYESAQQLIKNMNHYDNGVGNPRGYLGQTNWQLPSLEASCPTYGCGGDRNPMGNLYYDQLNFLAGTPVVPVPDIAVGPFHHLVPFPYWLCLAKTIQDACETGTNEPGLNSEWGFSFGTGFLGTERITANHYVTAYFVGCDRDESWCQTITFAPITGTEDALTSLALSATASSGLAVSFTSTTPKVCTVSGNTASLVFPGNCTIVASQAGDDSFESALPIQRTFTVGHATQTVTFAPIPNQKPGASLNLHATASSGLKIAYYASSSPIYSLAIGPAPVCEIFGNTADIISPGRCTIDAYQAGNDLYAPAFADRSFMVKAQ
jgi:hypothetical protein